jgi:four helix bundle protein
MTDQILRSIGSVGAHIAGGFNRSKKKCPGSLEIALGAAAETENWLYKLRGAGFVEKELVNAQVREGIESQKMLNGLICSIRDPKT